MTPPRSLGFRLVAGAVLWVALALLATGAGLTALFHAQVQAMVEDGVRHDLGQLVGHLQVSPDGRLEPPRRLSDPLFDKPFSGRYWQVETAGHPPLRSRSLWDTALPLTATTDGRPHRELVPGPEGQHLLMLERSVLLPELTAPVHIAVAVDHARIDDAVDEFRNTLAAALAALGGGLVLAVWLQVRVGLKPLDRLRTALHAVRGGAARRVEGDWPAEVAPLVADLNALLEHDAAVVARARTQAGDLAHALKTPLSVLANDAEGRDDALAETVRRQVEAMRRPIERHLARARAAGAAAVPGARTDARALAEKMGRVMVTLGRDRPLDLRVEGAAEAVFRGDREDLAEMLGNLLENAAKWARSTVLVTLENRGGRLVVAVDDDGPGLAAERRAEVFGRGVRLDEEAPGSGLGLAIVRDLAELYGGGVALDDSALGGLRAVLDLPAA